MCILIFPSKIWAKKVPITQQSMVNFVKATYTATFIANTWSSASTVGNIAEVLTIIRIIRTERFDAPQVPSNFSLIEGKYQSLQWSFKGTGHTQGSPLNVSPTYLHYNMLSSLGDRRKSGHFCTRNGAELWV